jgi:TetR/AcrR family transcriptional repressor of bet genes
MLAVFLGQSSSEASDGMNQTEAKARTRRRTASKKTRQKQLIRATIRSIAKHGLSETTMATVSSEAGLSQGIINLHFQSKERLLEETLLYVVSEYREAWQKALAECGNSAVERLSALVSVDFDRRICQRNKLAVWFAFWGESRSRLTYRKICTAQGREYKQMLTSLCEEIVDEGGYAIPPEHVATSLLSTTVGLWLDLLLSPADMNLEQAREISMSFLRGVFTRHDFLKPAP